jgi:hypothetical protein
MKTLLTLLILTTSLLASPSVSSDWLKNEFIPSFRKHLKEQRISYKLGEFDCRHYSALFKQRLRESVDLVQPELKGLAIVHSLTVNQARPFGGVPTQRAQPHMLITVETDAGKIVVEPQTGKWCTLDKYPNRLYTIRETL